MPRLGGVIVCKSVLMPVLNDKPNVTWKRVQFVIMIFAFIFRFGVGMGLG